MMSKGLSVGELLRDRLRKRSVYGTAEYWDKKAVAYEGLARSNWPANSYNEFVHQRQMQVLDERLGPVRGLRIADVGCGTGRASIHLAKKGARVSGFDFSREALAVAEAEARQAGVEVDFSWYDLLSDPSPELAYRFDVTLVLGVLTLACQDSMLFERALSHVTALLKPSGRLLFIEPIHSSPVLSRILRMSVGQWIARCERRGLSLLHHSGILFAPTRFALAFRDLPRSVVSPTFAFGERVLHWSHVEALSDYKVLLFRAPELPPPSTLSA